LPYILEETLKYGDVTSDLKSFLVYAEVSEALRPPRVFENAFTIDRRKITRKVQNVLSSVVQLKKKRLRY